MIPNTNFHIPVLVSEVLEYLNVQPGQWYLDCNFGGGGHSSQILELGGRVIGLDIDPEAITLARQNFKQFIPDKLILSQTNFANLDQVVDQPLVGVLFDLGVSSHQVDTPERGFSFSQDGLLDMRMDQSQLGATAKDLINGLYEPELARLFTEMGEESWAKPIAKKIVSQRTVEPITTTLQLRTIIQSVKKSPHKQRMDASAASAQVFQALRIAVNDELNSLKIALPKAFAALAPGGRLVVISFHSLEDRIVKNFFRELTESGQAESLTDKPVGPTDTETAQNSRSRSAKLRAIKKLAE